MFSVQSTAVQLHITQNDNNAIVNIQTILQSGLHTPFIGRWHFFFLNMNFLPNKFTIYVQKKKKKTENGSPLAVA